MSIGKRLQAATTFAHACAAKTGAFGCSSSTRSPLRKMRRAGRSARWRTAFSMAGLMLVWSPNVAAEDSTRKVQSFSEQRATLLAAHLPEAVRRNRGLPKVAGAVLGLGGAVEIGVVAAIGGPRSARDWAAVTSGTAWVGTGALAFLLPDAPDAHLAGLFVATGAGWAGLAENADVHWTAISTSVGFGTSALLSLTNALIVDPPSSAVLWNHYLSLRSPGQRERVSARRVARIERDLRRTRRPLPSWLVALPAALGGMVALAPAFDKKRSERARLHASLSGALATVEGVGMMLLPEPYRDYEGDMRQTGLKVSAFFGGPGFVVNGRF